MSCVAVQVPVDVIVTSQSIPAMLGALVGGLLVSLVLAVVGLKLCMTRAARAKDVEYDGTDRKRTSNGSLHGSYGAGRGGGIGATKSSAAYEPIRPPTADHVDGERRRSSEVDDRSSAKGQRGRSARRQSERGHDEDEPEMPISFVNVDPSWKPRPLGKQGPVVDQSVATKDSRKSLIDALLADCGEEEENVLADQEIEELSFLDAEVKEESVMTMIQMMRTMLGRQLEKGAVTPGQGKRIMESVQGNVRNAMSQAHEQMVQDKQKLSKAKITDPDILERENEKIRSTYMAKISYIIPNQRDDFRNKLNSGTGLHEDEINTLMTEFNNNMGRVDDQINRERSKQANAIDERLARRRQLLERQRLETESGNLEIPLRVDANSRVVSVLVDDARMTVKQRDQLLSQYDDDVRRLHTEQQKELKKQKESLALRLKKARADKVSRLQRDHQRELEKFVGTSENSDVATEDYQNLLTHQRQQENDLLDDIDSEEAAVISDLTQDQEKDFEDKLALNEENFLSNVSQKCKLSTVETQQIMDVHRDEMSRVQDLKDDERRRMKIQLEDRIEERKRRAYEEQQKLALEEESLKREQDSTLQSLLSAQNELSDRDRDAIMDEHNQNVQNINKNLKANKMRQQKLLEKKLNARRAKVDALKCQSREIELSNKDVKQKSLDKKQKQIVTALANEEKDLAKDQRQAIAELRERITLETKSATEEQEKKIGLIIARLQVGEARRTSIIKKQDQAIKDLEEQLSNRVSERKQSDSEEKVNTMIQHHYEQVNEMTDKLQDIREQQQDALQEKLDAKKKHKERQIENKLESEAQDEWQQNKVRGSGLATSILSQSMLEQRHKMALAQLQKEMNAEMQKQREQINRELEEELKEELEIHQKNFLSQLAAISKMSKDEVNQLVNDVIIDANGTEKEAKKLAKDIKVGMERAKTDLGIESEDSYDRRR